MSRTRPCKTSFGEFRKLTRAQVEWLKQDSKTVLEQATEVLTSIAGKSVAQNVKSEGATKEEILEAEQFAHHLRLATAVKLVVNGALNGNKWCGVFLGEIIPFLWRQEVGLMANEHFERCISELRSAQKARKKGRTLRLEIEEIIREARSQRSLHDRLKGERIVPEARKHMRDLERRAKLLKKEEFNVSSKGLVDLRETLNRVNGAMKAEDLHGLSDLTPSSADEWFERIIWPELQRRDSDLRKNPLISELKKANKSGKFQLSDLKTQAIQTVRRLAKLPRPYYFW